MEGILYKWTNYITGWQPRWFVLDSGILSYYDSQDDVCKGSKGSIKMSVCEIKVHPTDSTRLELIIPGEQHFYVKAVNAAERQTWLVALGSSKACLIDSRTKKEKDITETTESLKTKMSELRLYCDLLVQQVHTIQESMEHEAPQSAPSFEDSSLPSTPFQHVNDASSLLSATCNTFIKTLEECMKIANAKFKTEMFQLTPPDTVISALSPSPMQMVRMKRSISHPGTYSFDRSSQSPGQNPLPHQRFSTRRAHTTSETESQSDGYISETDRLVQSSKVNVNSELVLSIPEEMGTSPKMAGGAESATASLST
ncbi:pleckstrin homology domain-containing family A member 3 isoform X2 [Brienomyrus brachyistius]|uniref:pleckstrin homology domain-containing family A member 3 isoform X2 n=1 Tax=Brienomyrus brachyistius TaxID=42636 RepID=UPI0020B22250|nr:pleckstrin homology domain-containing family A member 3 isoform X2 [Brienomyrus brachyistius]